MASDLFYLLLINSWALVGFIFVLWIYGANEAAYKYGKLVLVFLIGVMLGVTVV